MSQVDMKKSARVAIIGGGIAGSTVALYLSNIAQEVTLFEKQPSLISGPPFCHLHAGGNLYREISDEQCITLLKESIDVLRFYPCAIDVRPTIIAIPTTDSGNVDALVGRLERLKSVYSALIEEDSANKVLGEVNDYYRFYERSDLERFKEEPIITNPSTFDEWLSPLAHHLDLDAIKYPFVMVQEYGWNLFRLAALLNKSLEDEAQCHLRLKHEVTSVKQIEKGWVITASDGVSSVEETFDYVINAAGFKTGEIDDLLHFNKERLTEFKAAYVSKWGDGTQLWPEIVFHGKRGTPQGMAQFTPYADGYFQLHGMTKEITLFDNGLVKSEDSSAYPKLGSEFIEKIEEQWRDEDVKIRTQRAIAHLAQYMPSFSSATVASKPLFGAQQIPGNDADLRAAEISFEQERYARCEIVKASSVLSMVDAIVKELVALGYASSADIGRRDVLKECHFSREEIDALAQEICRQRQYPVSMYKPVRVNEELCTLK